MIGPTGPTPRPTPDERHFLDMLCLYRSLYATRGPDDSSSVATVATIIGAAEMRMRALRIRDERLRRRATE